MTYDFEYNSYNDADRIAILENRAADLERRLLAFAPPDPAAGWGNVATPGGGRAERIQQIFSLEYDAEWEKPKPRAI